MSYLETTRNVNKETAESPAIGLCCTSTPIWQLPGLDIPLIMQQMNYECGSTVHSRDLVNSLSILYVRVGGGMKQLLLPNQPLAVCDKTASSLASLAREDIFISVSTLFYDGGGCC